MKTQLKFTQKKAFNTFGFIAIIMIATLAFNPVYSQSTETVQNERTVKGIINDEAGPLESVNIVLKGTKTGTTTNDKGEFTFPKLLKTGDILLISYLGYETQEIKIKANTSFIRLNLTQDLIEFVGALNSNKPYKSKRKN